MKQRLLLALLVLFASVGMVKAAANTVTITPASNTGTFKITWTGGEPTVSGDDAAARIKSGNTFTIKPNGMSVITLTGGSPNTTGYTFNGVVDNIVVDVEDYVTSLSLAGTVKNLTVMEADGITALNLSNLGLSSLSISSAAKLASLTLTGNYLNPAATTIIGTLATLKPQWGTQTLSASGVTNLNAKGINLTSADFTGSRKPLAFLNTSAFTGAWTFASWQKLNESNQTYATTGEAHAIPNVSGAFAFYDNSQYYTDGTYSCKVTRDGVSIVLTGIEIHPAKIVITIPASAQNGWGDEITGGIKPAGVTIAAGNCTDVPADHDATDVNTTTGYLQSYLCHQGDKVAIVATPKSNNYEFSKFEVSSGLVNETHSTGTSVSTFTVKAKCMTNNPAVQDPVTLKAVFKGKDCKISYNPSVLNGSFYITDVNNNNQKIANNATVEYGHRLRIQATPANTKYYAEYKVSDEEPNTVDSHNTTNADFKANNIADVFVDQDRTVTVNFRTDDVANSNDYTIKIQSPSDVTPSSTLVTAVIKALQIGTYNAASALTGNVDKSLTFNPTGIVAGTSIPISVTVADSKDYVVKSIQMGTQALNVINEGSGKFTANFIAPEDKNASFTIVVVKQSDAKVYINGEALTSGTPLQLTSPQKYSYDKQKHALNYITDPSGLTLDVLYKLSTLSDDYYTTDVPVAAGEYLVKVSRKADAYKEIAEAEVKTASGGAIIIDPATITITTPPTVTAQLNSKTNQYTFVLTGGVASSLGENVTSKGTFVVLDETGGAIDITDPADLNGASPYANNLVPGSFTGNYHNVAVRFMMKNDANYNPAGTRVRVLVGKATNPDTKYKLVVNSNIVTVDGQPSNINTVQAEIYNGATRVAYGKNAKTETTLGDGMQVYLRAIVDGYSKVEFIDMDPASTNQKLATQLVEGTTNTFETTAPVTLSQDYAFSIALSGKLNQVYRIQSFDRKEVTYNGEPQIYDPAANNLVIYKNGGNFTYTNLLLTSPIYYKDETGKVVTGGAPVEAGKYDICIDIPASVDPADPYDAQTLTASQALQILKKVPTVKWPTGVSRIGAGQRLSAAQLFTDGTADINGTFAWEDGTITPKNGQFYTIKFTPVDTKNYEVVYLYADDQRVDTDYEDLAITVSSKPIISIDGSVLNGSFIVKSGNVEYHTGNEVNDGTTLTITPVANDGFVCKSLIIDEGGTKHTSTGETTFKVNGKSIYVTGEFELKSSFDPNTQYTVILPKADAVRGVIIGKPGVNAVAKDGAFSFTLESLAADAKNLVVKVNGTVLAANAATAANATTTTYTLAKVDGNKTITVSLSNPTKIKVAVERETKNAKGFRMGTVEVDGLAADSTCYFGDEVTLVAFPESGVTFTGWSGSIGSTDKLATLTVKQALTIKPKFTGIPTGIDAIEATGIRGMQGYIHITCQAEASVTVIGMDGTHKVIRISGEARIPAATGIYGIILTQNGQEAIKTKVIVR